MLSQLIALSTNQPSEQVMDAPFVSAVVVTGILVVFSILVILVFFVLGLGKLFIKKPTTVKNVEQPKKKIKQALAEPKIEDGISDEIVAVISAAIASISAASSDGTTYAIKNIKQVKPQRPVWAIAGLRENTTSF